MIRNNVSLLAIAGEKLQNEQYFCLARFPRETEFYLYHNPRNHPVNQENYFLIKGWEQNGTTFYLSPYEKENEVPIKRESEIPPPPETLFENYAHQFEVFQEAFSNTVVKKAILSRIKHVAIPSELDEVSLFKRLETAYPDAMVYLLHLPKQGVWIGASPEILITEKDRKWTAVSLAGTQKRHSQSYTWGEKEREEHEFVSEHIRHTLHEMKMNDYSETGPFTTEAGSVAHLKTIFKFDAIRSDFDYLTYVNKVHPTPAISGTPLQEAIDLINRTESHKRDLYTGYLGRVTNKSIDLYVNLRCARVYSHKLVLYLGGGLTQQSVLEDEWQETEEKAKTLLKYIHE